LYNPGVNPGFTNGLEMDFSIYPNPTNGGMVVNASSLDPLKAMTLSVYGMEGKQVRSQNINLTGTSVQMQVDLSDLSAGYYFIELIHGNSRQVKPLIKQ
jgi:hypothetical protein